MEQITNPAEPITETPTSTPADSTPEDLAAAAQAEAAAEQAEFEAGFNLDDEAPEPSGQELSPTAPEPAQAAPAAQPVPTQPAYPQPEPEQRIAQAAQAAPAALAATVVPVAQVVPVAEVPQVAIDQSIADELAELTKLSPAAGALAREDSPEGASIRKRLSEYGADHALDRAELLLERRERAAQAETAQMQAIESYNSQFQQVLRTEHPDLFAPTRTPEQNQRLLADMQAWIEAKPYAEARGLMEIYERGRDPRQVAALITRFKQEGMVAPSAPRRGPDPTAALAVAGRGAPNMPKDIGGKDDFEAGWNL